MSQRIRNGDQPKGIIYDSLRNKGGCNEKKFCNISVEEPLMG